MPKIRLGGIKSFCNRAFLASSSRNGDEVLRTICSGLAANRVNTGYLTYIAGVDESITAACTKSMEAFSSCWYPGANGKESSAKLTGEIARISIYPHDQRPEVTACLLRILVDNQIKPYGFGSSPGAITFIISLRDFERTVRKLFDLFAFSTFDNYDSWRGSHTSPDFVVQETRCSYHEPVIHIYEFTHRDDLDLWYLKLPLDRLGRFSDVLSELGEPRLKMPFLTACQSPSEAAFHFVCAYDAAQHEIIEKTLNKNMPDCDYSRQGPVSILFLHGPHFGDRYGIANACVTALCKAGVRLLSMSCAVSSISLVIDGNDLNRAIEALTPRFSNPGEEISGAPGTN